MDHLAAAVFVPMSHPHAAATSARSSGSRCLAVARERTHDANASAPAAAVVDHRSFAFLADGYACHGGLIDGDSLAGRMRAVHGQPLSTLARWIVAREVVCATRHGATWLPLFQWDLATWAPRPVVRRIVRELRSVLDDEELAVWFIRPNGFLAERPPVARIDEAPDEVLEAARADRFVIAG
jgi:hypothetical protein